MKLHEAVNGYTLHGIEITRLNTPEWNNTTDDGQFRVVQAIEPSDGSASLKLVIYHIFGPGPTVRKFSSDDPTLLDWCPTPDELLAEDWGPLDRSDWPPVSA